MSARPHGLVALGLLAVAACAPQAAPVPAPARPNLVAACAGRDGWSDPAPPAPVFGNVYDVGTCGITVLLITSPQGHILIDGATEEAVPSILANIRALGFRPGDIRWLLASHEHVDHAGGLAALKQATGARLAVRAEARRAFETGEPDPQDPQLGLSTFAPVKVDRVLADGEVVTLGPLALTAHATPGHTPGSTSWTWRSCEGETCHAMAYVDSLTAVSADAYRFTDHPAYVATFRRTLGQVGQLDCEILMTPHPSASALFERLAGTQPLADPAACRRYAENGRERLDARLAREAGR
ncbi:subclass B3 metallo-beta-lactamase [Novosphingobium album (ex Liu et al. 2023)]|uniref:Subclass B3 metallo-beta-lactamase n=1 Tax=Novosphingobium album (ex Liu et al. 2023) TaxID=3031130 RepID=A0ABT5WJ66_9SPHN|nr:subclass B3 metallo-beta-lactamase [Novosphingobium album (ex Liu et al. 2023)]MDE8650104.1 subclass B3 metallo-beta-lactamase [Novosphingobium album (ex Liu et al. 2023)]